MTIRARFGTVGVDRQPTAASSFYEKSLASRLESQIVQRIPRSKASWGAEQTRLGAWNTGVGNLYRSGSGIAGDNGIAKPLFSYDPEEEETQR